MKYYNKDWYLYQYDILMNNKDYDKEYIDYMNKNLPEWYREFSIHDDQIKKVMQYDDCLIVDLAADDCKHTMYQLKFQNPKILEDCELNNAWCIADELYIIDDLCEYHLMVMNFDDNSIIEYFTVKCSNVELITDNKSFKVFNTTETDSI